MQKAKEKLYKKISDRYKEKIRDNKTILDEYYDLEPKFLSHKRVTASSACQVVEFCFGAQRSFRVIVAPGK